MTHEEEAMAENDTGVLFTPLRVGDIDMRNRIVMAPMTRSRADADGAQGRDVAIVDAQHLTLGDVGATDQNIVVGMKQDDGRHHRDHHWRRGGLRGRVCRRHDALR